MSEALFPQHLDSTILDAFKSCPQKAYNEFFLGLRRSIKSVDLHAGGVFASTLQTFYDKYFSGSSFEEAKFEAMVTFIDEWGDFVPPEKSSKQKHNMWCAFLSYLKEYPPDTDEMRPFYIDGVPSSEVTFAVPLLPEDGFLPHPVTKEPLFYSGRIDFLALRGDRHAIRDEKTTKGFGENWDEQWGLRAQFIGYCWALQQYGYDVREVTVRGIAILKTEIRHKEARPRYGNHLLERWHRQLKRDVNRMVKCWEEGYFDFNLGSSCSAYGGCIFTDLCKSPRPEAFYDNYAVKRWNPLHTNPEEEGGEKKEAT